MRLRKAIYVFVAVAALVAVHFLQGRLNADRDRLGLTRTEALKNAPPVLAFTTVALGSFRGLIANVLWIRTTELQEDGKYFEAVQLADWITKLQPHFTTVWVQQAWNMSYNISVKFSDPRDRWLWVQRGIELLRDEGLKYNPHDIGIHAELARHFHHKMGANLDDAHLTYKSEWARMMQEVLPGGRPDFPALLQPQTAADQARVRTLVEKYKLEPALMKQVDDTYGPLEWRLPETHAIYWAMRGLREARGAGDIMMLRRLIFQPMLMAFQRGRLITNNISATIEFSPNLEMIPNVSKAYLDMIAAEPSQAEQVGRAHRNFIKDAIYQLYVYGREKQAQQWLNYVRKTYGDNAAIPPDMTLEDFALSQVKELTGETSRDRVKGILEGYLENGYYSLAIDDDDHANQLLAMARLIHRNYDLRTDVNKSTRMRIPLPSIEEMKVEVLTRMLTPDPRTNPKFQDVLRSRLRLPADFARPAPTNGPPTAVPPAK